MHYVSSFRRLCCGFVVFVMIFAATRGVAQDGVLQAVRDEVREPSTAPARRKTAYDGHEEGEAEGFWSAFWSALFSGGHKKLHGHCDEDDESSSGSLWSSLIVTPVVGAGAAISAPFWGPPVWVGDHYGYLGEFTAYPYETDEPGYMVLPAGRDDMKSWSLRMRGEYADNFDGLQRFGGQVLWESAIRIGVDSTFDYRREAFGKTWYDSLWMGDTNVVYRFAQSEQLTMRTGLGMNWLSDCNDSDFGFNFTYAGDWFPVQPWIFSSELDWGRLGSAGLIHVRTTAGVNYHHCEIYGGYDFTRIGSADLGGFVTGVRFWY